MEEIPGVTVIEHCSIAPPRGTAAECSVPLTFWDARWLNFHLCPFVFFYELPHPTTYFVDTIIPKLKQSLSLALKHYLPMAGNLVYSPDSAKLELRFVDGDSVSLTFAESSDDFGYLSGHHPREAQRFYPLLPQFKTEPPTIVSGSTVTPIFALQVTIFPNFGISMAYTAQHTIGDASTVLGFLKTWGSINKFGEEDVQFLASNSLLPFYDRSMMKDPYDLLGMILNEKKKGKPWGDLSNSIKFAIGKVRATFVIGLDEMKRIKNFIVGKRPNLVHISNMVASCALLWTCWLKSMHLVGEEVDDDEPEFFLCAANYRKRLDPPMPPEYFGNCIVPCIAKSTHGELVGRDGLLVAAQVIGEAIHTRVHDRETVLNGGWLSRVEAVKRGRNLGVNGSPLYNSYNAEFGWGKPVKYESISIDIDGGMSIDMSSKFEGAWEVTLSLLKGRMEAFATIFASGLNSFSLQSKF